MSPACQPTGSWQIAGAALELVHSTWTDLTWPSYTRHAFIAHNNVTRWRQEPAGMTGGYGAKLRRCHPTLNWLAGVKQVGSQGMYFSADIHTSVPFLCGIKLSLSAAVLFELVDTFFSVGSILIKLKKSQLNCWGKSRGDLPLYKRWVVCKRCSMSVPKCRVVVFSWSESHLFVSCSWYCLSQLAGIFPFFLLSAMQTSLLFSGRHVSLCHCCVQCMRCGNS